MLLSKASGWLFVLVLTASLSASDAFNPSLSAMPLCRAAALTNTRVSPLIHASRPVAAKGRAATLVCSTASKVDWTPKLIKDDPNNNVTPYIASLVGRDLHLRRGHPLHIIKTKIEAYFTSRDAEFECKDSLDPIVTAQQCFDDLLIPEHHQSRRQADTYYVTKDTLLRTHTSAHQTELLRQGSTKFLCTGDVYRRDEIDSSHYPAFHQMEGVKILKECEGMSREEYVKVCEDDLKSYLEGMIDNIFGPVEKRWIDAYFPFTDPSYELEIYFNDDWLEVLGCGVIQQPILDKCGMESSHGWAFGLGLERLAMVLFDIPDIRLFWTEDKRFLSQFKDGEITKFKPYSKYPPCYKDIAFWLPEAGWEENDFAELVRNIAGDIVESVGLIDKFENPKKGKTSHCYRINYRAMDRSLTNEEVDALQEQVRDQSAAKLKVVLR